MTELLGFNVGLCIVGIGVGVNIVTGVFMGSFANGSTVACETGAMSSCTGFVTVNWLIGCEVSAGLERFGALVCTFSSPEQPNIPQSKTIIPTNWILIVFDSIGIKLRKYFVCITI